MTKKRKAIDCKLIRPSTSNPGYFKYEVIIEDVEGNTTTQPAYGTDMQDAINRLIWNERIEKVSKVSKKAKIETPILFALAFICIVGPAIWSSMQGTPLFSVAGLSMVAVVGTAVYWFNHWLSKR
tara:strand:- start:2407 stop:2781 length:375 start_codon:yes stop_codon:yes gene_type:complete